MAQTCCCHTLCFSRSPGPAAISLCLAAHLNDPGKWPPWKALLNTKGIFFPALGNEACSGILSRRGRGWQAWREKDLIMPAQGLRLCQLSSSLLQLALAGQSKSLWGGYEPSSPGASLRHTCDVIPLSLLVLHNLFPPLP